MGALGAYSRDDYTLSAGDTLKILVGQMGSDSVEYGGTDDGGGGGGGSFIALSDDTPLIVAGGGGGQTSRYTNGQGPGRIFTNGGCTYNNCANMGTNGMAVPMVKPMGLLPEVVDSIPMENLRLNGSGDENGGGCLCQWWHWWHIRKRRWSLWRRWWFWRRRSRLAQLSLSVWWCRWVFWWSRWQHGAVRKVAEVAVPTPTVRILIQQQGLTWTRFCQH